MVSPILTSSSGLPGDTLQSSYKTGFPKLLDLHTHNYNLFLPEMLRSILFIALHTSSRARADGTPLTATSPLPFDASLPPLLATRV
jgi:hypothetical protein